ncbi:MAG: hypothetical protein CVU31_01070 [Betaproteobacteria bacterium HGW-Betaproteobacteria-4]|jgi:hypothetical protein|nr:MAG: hypothetical protein CVU31_01070 [Betaproteobacteria bacterium HGW-Betaproteobacteria-4]
MKKLAVILIAITSLLSGCVVYDGPYRDGDRHRGDRDGQANRSHDRSHDRDRDGVPDRQDRRPHNPTRY